MKNSKKIFTSITIFIIITLTLLPTVVAETVYVAYNYPFDTVAANRGTVNLKNGGYDVVGVITQYTSTWHVRTITAWLAKDAAATGSVRAVIKDYAAWNTEKGTNGSAVIGDDRFNVAISTTTLDSAYLNIYYGSSTGNYTEWSFTLTDFTLLANHYYLVGIENVDVTSTGNGVHVATGSIGNPSIHSGFTGSTTYTGLGNICSSVGGYFLSSSIVASNEPAATPTPTPAPPSVSELELIEHLEIGSTIIPFNPASLKTLGINNNYQFNGTIFNGNTSLDTAAGLYSYGYTLQSTTDFSNITMQNTSSEYNYTDGSFKFTLPEPVNESYMILGVFYTVEGYEGATGYYYYIKWEGTIYHNLPTEAPTTADPTITAFTNDLISFLVALVCIVALGGVLGWKYGLWGFVAGANIGVFLSYLYLDFPIWAVVGIIIVDGLLFFATRGKE